MSKNQWTEVDQFISRHLNPNDEILEAALRANKTAELPAIDVSPNQGKFLHILARLMGARRILEIGTLGGYSSIWLARALPSDGKLVTLEYHPKHAEVARSNIARAGLSDRVEIREGRALDLLPELKSQAPFDLTFIDADKPNNSAYFNWALKFSRKGSLIIVDNVVRDGAIVDFSNEDPNVKAGRDLHETIARERRVTATTLQTVGVKGYDGFAIALVIE